MPLLPAAASRRHGLSLLVAWLTLTSACASGPAPLTYSIPSVPPSTGGLQDRPVVAVADVRLPGYARGRAMAHARTGSNQVNTAGHERWSDELDVLATDALAQRLRALGLNAWTRPLPSGMSAQYTVEAVFDTFLWRDDSGLEMQGMLLSLSSDGTVRSQSFSFVQASDRAGMAAFSDAAGAGLLKLAQRLEGNLENTP